MSGKLDRFYVYAGTGWRFPLVQNAVAVEDRTSKVSHTRAHPSDEFPLRVER